MSNTYHVCQHVFLLVTHATLFKNPCNNNLTSVCPKGRKKLEEKKATETLALHRITYGAIMALGFSRLQQLASFPFQDYMITSIMSLIAHELFLNGKRISLAATFDIYRWFHCTVKVKETLPSTPLCISIFWSYRPQNWRITNINTNHFAFE